MEHKISNPTDRPLQERKKNWLDQSDCPLIGTLRCDRPREVYGEIKCACGEIAQELWFFFLLFLVLKIFCLQPCWLQDISRKRVATTTTCNTSPVLSDYSAFCMVKHLSAQTSRHVHAEHNECYHWVICSETYTAAIDSYFLPEKP